jgi:hypothetical protein
MYDKNETKYLRIILPGTWSCQGEQRSGRSRQSGSIGQPVSPKTNLNSTVVGRYLFHVVLNRNK